MASKTYSLLLVDDDRQVVDSMADWLRHLGYLVTTATSHREALQLVDRRGLELRPLHHRTPCIRLRLERGLRRRPDASLLEEVKTWGEGEARALNMPLDIVKPPGNFGKSPPRWHERS